MASKSPYADAVKNKNKTDGTVAAKNLELFLKEVADVDLNEDSQFPTLPTPVPTLAESAAKEVKKQETEPIKIPFPTGLSGQAIPAKNPDNSPANVKPAIKKSKRKSVYDYEPKLPCPECGKLFHTKTNIKCHLKADHKLIRYSYPLTIGQQVKIDNYVAEKKAAMEMKEAKDKQETAEEIAFAKTAKEGTNDGDDEGQ